jgi:hypothetical protein
MQQLHAMLQSHPHGANQSDLGLLSECISACLDCELMCSSCADACLSEDTVDHLRYCIRLNLDCADICATTGRMMARQTKPDADVMRAQLHACIAACKACGDECARHASMHKHCAFCADACRRCEQACHNMLNLVPARV